MKNSTRVYHVSGNTWMRLCHVLEGIEYCALGWVEKGKTYRNLTDEESIAARNEQARLREPLSPAEVPGLTYEPSASGREAYRMGRQMVLDATAMCAGYYHPVSA